ncbi:MAG TPA: hypothetical protein VK821_11285, partial [Dehalococcoidia bacterium]|nr:hypothetical protein [Dehalococcoidia bacterium]
MASGGGLGPVRGGMSLPGGRALPGLRTFGPWQTGLLIAALILGGLGGYWGFTHFYEASHAPPQVGQPVRVVRTTIRNTVSATGTVAAT